MDKEFNDRFYKKVSDIGDKYISLFENKGDLYSSIHNHYIIVGKLHSSATQERLQLVFHHWSFLPEFVKTEIERAFLDSANK